MVSKSLPIADKIDKRHTQGMVKELKKLFGFGKTSKKKKDFSLSQKELENRVNQATSRAVKEYSGAFERLAEYDRSSK